MKLIPQTSGPFKKWPFFQPDEIEHIATADLRTHGLLPATPSPVNIDALVTKLFGFDPDYTDTGDGVLGYIRFDTRRPEKILLHEALADLEAGPTTEHRRRSTLAHECGHGRLHAGPFTELMQAKKAGHGTENVRDPSRSAVFLCRATDVRDDEGARPPASAGLLAWERMAEWQANRYMAALLVPARLARQAVADLLGGVPEHASIRLEPPRRDLFAAQVARRFEVSRQLASCRLAELFPAPTAQGELFAAA